MNHKNKNQLTTWAKILRAKRLGQGDFSFILLLI